MKILLDRWDAAELFNRIIARFNKLDSIAAMRSTTVFENRLKEYSQRPLNNLITQKIFGTETKINKVTNKEEKVALHPTLFYEFCRQLNHGEPVVIPNDIFKIYKRYIKCADFAEETKIILREFKLNQKQRQLEGTKWGIYFWDDCVIKGDNGRTKLREGVSRGILSLNAFGKAEFIRKKKYMNEERVYTGIYRVCKNDEYLSFKMKTKNSRERDLRMLFYIGNDKMNIALGLAGNVSESVYSKTVIIEPLDNSPDPNWTGFCSKDSSKQELVCIPDYIWNYLKEKDKNIVRLPHGKITTALKLAEWMEKSKSKNGNERIEDDI